MKRSNVAICLLASLSLVAGSAAANYGALANWVPVTGVEYDIDGAAPAAYVSFGAAVGNAPAACATIQGALGGTAEDKRQLMSIATAAYLAGKNVKVSAIGCTSANYINVVGLFMQ